MIIARRFATYFAIILLRLRPNNPWVLNDLHIDKAWHGVHYLLTGVSEGGKPPLSYAILGGAEIGSEGLYGRTRFLWPQQVKEVSAALDKITANEFAARINLPAMFHAGIYPVESEYRSKEERQDEYDYYLDYFNQIKLFYRDAADHGNAIIFFLS